MEIKLVGGKVPTLKFLPEVMDDLDTIIGLSNKEVGWLGHIIRDGNVYTVDEIYVPKQEVESTTAEISPEGQVACLTDTGWDRISLWGHSHVDMSCAPSGQDDKQFQTLLGDDVEFFVRQISNKRGEHHLSLYDDARGIIVEGLPLIRQINVAVVEHWQKELQEKVMVKQHQKQTYDFRSLPQIYHYNPDGKITTVTPTAKADDKNQTPPMSRKERKKLRRFLEENLGLNSQEYMFDS